MAAWVGSAVGPAARSIRCGMSGGKYVIAKMGGVAPFTPSTATCSCLLTATVLSGPLCELTVFCQVIEELTGREKKRSTAKFLSLNCLLTQI